MNNLGYNSKNYFGSDVVINANELITGDLTVNGDVTVDGTLIIPNVEVDTLKVNLIEGKDHPVNKIDLSNASYVNMQWKAFSPNTTNQITGDAFKLSLTGATNPYIDTYDMHTNYIETRNEDFLLISNSDNWPAMNFENGSIEMSKSQYTPGSFVKINDYKMPDAIGLSGQVMTSNATDVVFQSVPSYTNVTQQDVLFSLDPINPLVQLSLLFPFAGGLIYNYAQNTGASIPQNKSLSDIVTFPTYSPPDTYLNYVVFDPESLANYFSYSTINPVTPSFTSPIQMTQTTSSATYYQKVIVPIIAGVSQKPYQRLYLDIAFKGLGEQVNIYVEYGNTVPVANVNNSLFTTSPGAIGLESFTPSSPYEFKNFVRKEYDLQPSALNTGNIYIIIEQQYSNTGLNPGQPGLDGLCIGRLNVYGQYVSSGFGTVVPNTSLQHDLLLGLALDDHFQYPLLTGRIGDTLNIDAIQSFSTPGILIENLDIQAGAISNITNINGFPIPANPDFNSTSIIYQSGGAPPLHTNIVSTWAGVVSKVNQLNINQIMTVYIDSSIQTCEIDQSLDCKGRVVFTSSFQNAGAASQMKILDGFQLTSPRAFTGVLEVECESITTSSIILNTGDILVVSEGAVLDNTVTSLVPSLQVADGNFNVVSVGQGSNLTTSSAISFINVGIGSTLVYTNIINLSGNAFTANTISSTDNTATLLYIVDSSINQSALVNAGYTGATSINNVSTASNTLYDDSVVPNSGSTNVQGVIDWLKGQINAVSIYAGFQNCVYTPSTSNFGNSFGGWFDCKTFIEANTTDRCVTCFLNDLNYVPPSGVITNADINGGGRLTFAPYRVNALNPVNLDLLNGLTFTNIGQFLGPMVIRTESIATNILDFSDGMVIRFKDVSIQPSASSTIPLFNIKDKNVLVEFDNVLIDLSLNPGYILFDMNNTGNLSLQIKNAPATGNYNDIAQGGVGSTFTLVYDSTLDSSALTQTGYLGSFVPTSTSQAISIYYDDSVLPNLSVGTVQEAVDEIKQKYLYPDSSQFSLFGFPLASQQTATGDVSQNIIGGNIVNNADTFTGGIGATAYTIGDIVRALKTYGLLVN